MNIDYVQFDPHFVANYYKKVNLDTYLLFKHLNILFDKHILTFYQNKFLI